MTVSAEGARFEFDCAHGNIDAPLLQSVHGAFSATGVYVHEHGGPIRVGEPPDSHPSTYAGQIVAGTMTLSVRLADTHETFGPFTLTFGSSGTVVKCL
jgi:hypothetical protein